MDPVTTTTCIVAIADKGIVHIGGDAAGVAGYQITIHKTPKVFKKKDKLNNVWVFGYTTSFRMGQLIEHELKIPALKKDEEDVQGFMVKKFIPALRKCLKKGEWEKKEHSRISGGTFIVGIRGKIFIIQDDHQVAEQHKPYGSVGCGAQIALGSLYSTPDKPVKERLQLALEAAAEFSAGVRGPFTLIHT